MTCSVSSQAGLLLIIIAWEQASGPHKVVRAWRELELAAMSDLQPWNHTSSHAGLCIVF